MALSDLVPAHLRDLIPATPSSLTLQPHEISSVPTVLSACCHLRAFAHAVLSARMSFPQHLAWLAPSVHSKKPSVEDSFRDGPQGSMLLPYPCVIPSSWWARLRDLLLTNRTQQKQWVLLFHVGLQKDCDFCPAVFFLSPSLACSEGSQLPCCELSMERPTWQGTKDTPSQQPERN